jgi:beta-catenin-like protein 1
MESEADLESEIRNLMQITSAPQLYPELIRLGTVSSILSILSHENTDLVFSCVELLSEITDEEIVPEEDGEAEEAGVRELIKCLLDGQALELAVQNLSRMDERAEEDRKGVFNVLGWFALYESHSKKNLTTHYCQPGFIENVIAVEQSAAAAVVAKTDILPFLLKRIQGSSMDSNRQYACEILAILLQADGANRMEFLDLGGMDVILKCLARYRSKDPKEDEETEYMENLFDVACAMLQETKGKAQFLAGEGLELMLIMLK